jgi:hypothetical protein
MYPNGSLVGFTGAAGAGCFSFRVAGALAVHNVALVITTLCSFENSSRRNPSATFTGAACSAIFRGVVFVTSIQ